MKRVLGIILSIIFVSSIFAGVSFNKVEHIHAATWTCPDHGSKYVKVTVTKATTCMEQNMYYFTCSYVDDTGIQCSNISEQFEGNGPHKYTEVTTYNSRVEPTCTKAGSYDAVCEYCLDAKKITIAALGHKYSTISSTAATCEEDGATKKKCSRCGYIDTITVSKLGHDFLEEIVDATCVLEGKKTTTCSRCDYLEEEIYPANGHTVIEKERVEASCLEDGYIISVCEVCEEETKEVISATGHSYPEEWTIVKEAGLFSKGEKEKVCADCSSKLTEEIDAKVSPIFAVVSISSVAALAAFGIWMGRAASIKKSLKLKASLKEIDDKVLVINLLNEENRFKDLFKSKTYLQVNVATDEEFVDANKDNEPDLTIIEIGQGKTIDQALQQMDEAGEVYEDASFAIITSEMLSVEDVEKLQQLKEEEKIVGYVVCDEKDTNVLIKLILPLYKPEFTLENGVEKLGDLCDALGIPYVSTITNLYVTGVDIKDNLDKDEKGYDEISTIIADVASVLGIDQVETIKDMIDSTIAVKDAFAEDHGANESKEGIKGAATIVENIKDIL